MPAARSRSTSSAQGLELVGSNCGDFADQFELRPRPLVEIGTAILFLWTPSRNQEPAIQLIGQWFSFHKGHSPGKSLEWGIVDSAVFGIHNRDRNAPRSASPIGNGEMTSEVRTLFRVLANLRTKKPVARTP